ACPHAKRETDGSAAAPAARYRNFRRGSFIFEPPFRFTSLDHLVGGYEERIGHREVECLGGFEVDDKSVHRLLLKWQIARFLGAQNTVDVGSGLAKYCSSIRAVGDQSSGCRKRRIYGDCGDAVACQKGRHLRSKRENGNVGRKKNAAIRLLCQACDGAFDVSK